MWVQRFSNVGGCFRACGWLPCHYFGGTISHFSLSAIPAGSALVQHTMPAPLVFNWAYHPRLEASTALTYYNCTARGGVWTYFQANTTHSQCGRVRNKPDKTDRASGLYGVLLRYW